MKNIRLKSLNRKLNLIIGSLTMLFALFFYLYFPRKLENEQLKFLEKNAKSISQISSIIVSSGLFFDDYEAVSDGLEPILQNKNISYIVVLNKSDSIYYVYHHEEALQHDFSKLKHNSVVHHNNMFCLSSDIMIQNNYLGQLYLGYSLNELKTELHKAENTITIISVIILIIGLVLTHFLGKYITSPLTKMVETVNQVATGNLALRAEVVTEDEVGYLAKSFNKMLEIIQSSQKELENKNAELSQEVIIRKAIELNLKLSENRFRMIFHKSNDFIYLSEIDENKRDHIIEANEAMCNTLGYTQEELYGMSYLDLISEQEKDSEDLIQKIFDEGSIIRESVYRTKSGGEITLEINVNLFHLEGKKAILAIARNISDRKFAEAALVESEERFRGIYNNATIGIYRTGEAGELLMANPALVEMLGYDSYDKLVNSNRIAEIYEKKESRELFRQIIKDKGTISGFETLWIKSDGSRIYVRESARLVKDENNNIQYYEGVVEDITNWKETEQALIEAKEKAEESDRLKSEFLAQMSHEIRTPINTIMNFTSLLRMETEDKISEELSGGFDSIENAANRLLRTIDLVLNMSDVESGTYEAYFKTMHLTEEVLFPVHSEFKRVAAKKNLQLILNNESADDRIFADNYTITQIMANLVDNAIKYTDKGEVKITVKDADKNILVAISDTGIGISSEYLPKLFNKFSQEEQGYTRRYEGNGLGLALVKEYCDINNAEISVESEKGKGTCFKLLLPRNGMNN